MGIVVVGIAAGVMSRRTAVHAADPYLLQLRIGIGHDAETLLRSALDAHLRERRLVSMSTARQGLAFEVTYRAALRTDHAASELVQGPQPARRRPECDAATRR